MISKKSLIKKVITDQKKIYLNKKNWDLAWKGLYPSKKSQLENKNNIYQSSQIYKLITLTEVFDNKTENDNLNCHLSKDLYSLLEDGYKIFYEDKEDKSVITSTNYKEYILNKLKKYKEIAIKKIDEDNKENYKMELTTEVHRIYSNLKKFI